MARKKNIDLQNLGKLISYLLRHKAAVSMAILCMLLYSGAMFGKIALSRYVMDDILAPNQKTIQEKSMLKKFTERLLGSSASYLETEKPEENTAVEEKEEDRELSEEELREMRRGRMNELYVIIVIAGFFALLSGASLLGKEYYRRYLMNRTVVDIRSEVGSHVLGLSMDFYSERKGGDLINRMTNDLMVTHKAFQFLLGDIIQAPIMILVGVTSAFVISWQLATVTFIILPFIMFILLKSGPRIRRHSKQSLEKLADVTDLMVQMFGGIRIVKAFSLEDYEREDFKRANERYFRKAMKMIRDKVLAKSLLEFAYNLAMVVLIFVGAYLVIEGIGGVTLGVLTAFLIILVGLAQPLKNGVRAFTELSEAVAGGERVFSLLDLKPTVRDRPDAVELSEIRNEISFENVTFRYEEDSDPVLRDVNFTAEVGKTYAFVGRTGSGKSTLLDLLCRFYDVSEGKVLIDGKDARDYTHASLLRHVAIVGQHPFLFNTSIKKNIRLGRLGAPDEDVYAAAAAAHVTEFAEAKPEGFDTVVGERGDNLSGGERQRVTIARALLKDASVLVLDEATSSLDSASEKLVQDALARLLKGRTAFIVAHRLSTIKSADRIFVIDCGTIMEQGTHEELLRKGGLYADLCRQQLDVGEEDIKKPEEKDAR